MPTDSDFLALPQRPRHWHHAPLVRRIQLAIRDQRHRKQQRLQMLALKNLSDHLLNDIGLTREDAARISDTGSNAKSLRGISTARLG